MKEKVLEIIKNHVPEIRMQQRKANEQEARQLIVQNLGGMTASQLATFFEKIDTDYWDGKSKQGRFGITFLGNNRKLICEQVDVANKWIQLLWNAKDDECAFLVDKFMKERPLKGAKYGFPSLILYLRDPNRFNIWLDVMWAGMKVYSGKTYSGDSGTDYEKLNSAINQFRDEFQIAPQSLDIVLTELSKLAPKSSGEKKTVAGQADNDTKLFTTKTFELLKKMHDAPLAATYHSNKEDIKKLVEFPLQTLLLGAVSRLPKEMTDFLETEKKIFARFLKNDYGQGGAWDYYWGALYPKGGKRNSDAQLFAWMNHEVLEFGFYIGDYGDEQKTRFIKNVKLHSEKIVASLSLKSSAENILFGGRNKYQEKGVKDPVEWFQGISTDNIGARVELKAGEVISISKNDLIDRVARVFETLFPLVLMASDDDPISKIASTTDEDDSENIIHPDYTIEECANDCGLEVDVLARWVRAIDRKGQAIIYGPPGTGKTFTAKLLAKHLVRESDGFIDFIQFHPAYAYEDFMQGIRPKPTGTGGLSYPLVPGRFLEFCAEARRRKGICVLILDEINRANLSRVFGELMYLLEYRGDSIPLAAGEKFSIPDNVRIIGTMNTADRSIALVDHALRRRFAFLELHPNYGVLEKYHAENSFAVSGLVAALKDVNRKINDRNYSVGISFFLRNDLESQIEDIWRMEIEPYLEEYFFAQPSNADDLKWDKVRSRILAS
ncbi:McrB family protein [Geobacter sulfurreducens]|uniref:McrB family protein n=1 Tax=Geobacter sulfurreducens TaxID=35554 RepID=UPI000DBBA56B|nr:AAA family ATPase [Geobacter sulfurreducens]BBA70622.1 5-methylcytosine-specific restriction enzyme B [Geobacter sulfurreducens]